VEIRTFHCPKCRAILQISGAPPTPSQERIVRCSQCEFIFPLPVASADASSAPEEEAISREAGSVVEQPAPATWVNWQPSMNVQSAPPAAEAPPRRPRRPYRPKRHPFPWIFLIVGLLVALASIGLLIVLIVALWPK
jgi:hypothetical protein